MKRILLNATQTEETRVAIVDGQYLYDLDIESVAQNKRKSNVYKGIVTRVEASLEAAFIDYGAGRHGFLPLKEIASSLFSDGSGKRIIQKALKEGQELIVQVEKEERGNKGAALTTQISLAGRYLVLMPRTEGSGGISKKVESNDRDELRDAMDGVGIPADMSAIARTMALGRSTEELQWDLNFLLELWKSIVDAGETRQAPFLIYQESNIVSRTIRDHLRSDVSDIVIDDPAVYAEAVEFMQQLMPHNLGKLSLYEDSIPLFTRYQIENQIETAHQRTVTLRSGGSIVIDHTEALTSVDINSARATQGSDIEETAFRTNMEAAEEVARQLRLRDLGGLLVIDFIDMNSNRNQREVETCLRDATKADRARIQIGKISRFGLLEMSRQRLGASLRETSAITCPRCDGQGTIRTVESLTLHILRLIEDEAHKERTARISIQVPVAVATFMFNEKRDLLAELDKRLGMHALILPNPNLETPHYDIQRTRVQDLSKTLVETSSFDLPVIAEEKPADTQATTPVEQPVVTPGPRATPPPTPVKQKKKGLLARLFGWFGSEPEAQPKKGRRNPSPDNRRSGKRSGKDGGNRSRNRDNRNNSGRNDPRRSQGNRQDGQSSRQPGNRSAQGNRGNKNANNQNAGNQNSGNKNQGNKDQGNRNNSADQQSSQQSADGGQRQSSRSSSRRGNRGGRGNRQNENQNENRAENTSSSQIATEQSPIADSVNQQPAAPVVTDSIPGPTAPQQANSPTATTTKADTPPPTSNANEQPSALPSAEASVKPAADPGPVPANQTASQPKAPSAAVKKIDSPAPQAKPAGDSPAPAAPSTTSAPQQPVPATSPVAQKPAVQPRPQTATAPVTKAPPEPKAPPQPTTHAAAPQPAKAAATPPPQQTAKAPDSTKAAPEAPKPKVVPGQIETRSGANKAPVEPSAAPRTPAPRPANTVQQPKPATTPTTQIETQNRPD